MRLPNKIILTFLAIVALTGCDTGIRQMGPTEYGVRFRRLPPMFGGGAATDVIAPTQMTVVWPWDSVYRFDIRVQDVSWGPGGRSPANRDQVNPRDLMSQNMPVNMPVSGSENTAAETEDMGAGEATRGGYVNTRALDGNEVALAVTVAYQISPDKLVHLVQNVATSDREVRDLVVAVARADIRTHMNYLETSAFLDDRQRYQAVDKVRESMNARLEPLGIVVLENRVTLNDFRFERVVEDGTVDSSYQDRLKEIQRIRQDTERERQRSKTVKAKKEQELNEAQAEVNRKIAESNGYLDQAKFRGDAYFQSKENDAKAILATGKAQVTGLIEQVNALSGPGGAAILKLELARQLMLNDPRFVVMDDGQGAQGIDVRKTDTNELLKQIGILDALGSSKQGSAGGQVDETVPSKPTVKVSQESARKNSSRTGGK